MQNGASLITKWDGLDVLQRKAAFLLYKAGQVVQLNRAVFIKSDIDHKVGQYRDQKKFGQKKFPASISLIIRYRFFSHKINQESS